MSKTAYPKNLIGDKMHKENFSEGAFTISAPMRQTSKNGNRTHRPEIISIPQMNSGLMLRKILKEDPDDRYEKIKV
jgi:hypothetical protein